MDVVRIVGLDVVSLRCGGCGEDCGVGCGEVEVRWMRNAEMQSDKDIRKWQETISISGMRWMKGKIGQC